MSAKLIQFDRVVSEKKIDVKRIRLMQDDKTSSGTMG